MKIIFYLLIVVIIIYCLIINLYRNKKESFSETPEKPVINRDRTKYDPTTNTLSLEWTKPESLEAITGYMIMIKKASDTGVGVFMKFYNEADCETCQYNITDLELEGETIYNVAVMAINKYGTSEPSEPKSFVTPLMPTLPATSTPTPPIETPAPSGAPTLQTILGEDGIQNSLRNRQIYLDQELQNMTSRANGVYEVNSNHLEYPNNYIDEIRQSVKTLNDTVKKDLQEYRLNVHLAAVTELTSTPSTPSSTPASVS